MELALIMFLCENSFHARFIRLFYSFVLIFKLRVNDLHALFAKLQHFFITQKKAGKMTLPGVTFFS